MYRLTGSLASSGFVTWRAFRVFDVATMKIEREREGDRFTIWLFNIGNWKIHLKMEVYSWENNLFLWAIFQFAMLNDQRVSVFKLKTILQGTQKNTVQETPIISGIKV
jgi:hypothetical protein